MATLYPFDSPLGVTSCQATDAALYLCCILWDACGLTMVSMSGLHIESFPFQPQVFQSTGSLSPSTKFCVGKGHEFLDAFPGML